LQLVDAGYDVWVGSNRGTEYSQGHKKYNAKTSTDYWMFTWADMGLFDDVSNINTIKRVTGEEKIFYVGYSQGTAQMFYALSHVPSLEQSLHRVVQLAPCFIPYFPPPSDTVEYSNATIMQYQSKNIWAFNGPNWERDLPVLCTNFGKDLCDYFGAFAGWQASGVENGKYWTTVGVTQRFQEYNINDWKAGTYDQPLIPIQNIKVPLSFIIVKDDVTCLPAQAKDRIPEIGSPVKVIEVEKGGHEYFAFTSNDAWFMEKLTGELKIPSGNLFNGAIAISSACLSVAAGVAFAAVF
jgi:pimeloyl-ACP methyl ester carboxylesterase